jgi:hypothetical protein
MTQTETIESAFEITLENQKEPSERGVFWNLFSEAVDSAFSMLGDQGMRLVYHHLEDNYEISREKIPNEVGRFAEILEKVFGQAARLFEIRIMGVLHRKVPGFNFSAGDEKFSFVDYVEALRLYL